MSSEHTTASPAELTIHPVARPLRGTARVPGDKSISHRVLILGALADGPTVVRGWLPAADCLATLRCVRALGVRVDVSPDDPTSLTVHGVGAEDLQEPDDVLDCDGSGTTMRLLCGLLAGRPFFSVLTGREALRRRPMRRVAEPLRLMGATVLGRHEGAYAPLAIRGGLLEGIEYPMPVASAQVKSALLLAGLQAGGTTTIHQPGPARDHTERLLKAMGAPLHLEGDNIVRVRRPDTPLRPLGTPETPFLVPGDFSSAAFLLVAGLLVPESDLVVLDVGVNPTRTGALEILRSMGADITVEHRRHAQVEPIANVRVRASRLQATHVGGEVVVRAIDEFPIIAVAATQAHGSTVVRDAAELRVKETDRIANVARELNKMGARVEPRPDGFVVHGPTPLHGAEVESHGDHRLAMALAIAALIAEGTTTIRGADVIADSFPSFTETLSILTDTGRKA
ncbi:MAG: 3-phosphoshikimate 1-carboxyvinyltransferase [Ardenticatenia bacterium]|nr:3-phosphoshikimate 1-carboxyvinyltransferase [Ardenticatenia bacterium]